MKVPKIAEEEAPVDPRISLKEQLKTDKGDLANPIRWITKTVFFRNGPKPVPTYRTLDSPIFLITWWEKIPYTTAKAYKVTNLYWGTNYFLMDMWKNFGITHLNPIVIKVILSLL